MNIVVGFNKNSNIIKEYFDFNQIPYESNDLWVPTIDQFGRNIIPDALLQSNSNTLLVIDFATFFSLCEWPVSRQQLISFCANDNIIWTWNDIDGLVNTLERKDLLLQIDQEVQKNSIKLFVDGALSDRNILVSKLHNICVESMPYNFFFQYLRITNSLTNKVSCSRDFMLTAIKKKQRPHREILWNQINAIDGLIDCGHVNYGTGRNRIGLQSHQHRWHDGHPSMDLYRDSWMEIVPETLYQGGYFITEKTIKPIITKTPFLMVTTRYYLEYLKLQGFRTFSNIIDEQYDTQPCIKDRVRLMLVQLQDIIKNGSGEFYKECSTVLEHNQNRLFEIAGRKQYEMDVFIARHLETVGIQ
jgi:hypothetical protein